MSEQSAFYWIDVLGLEKHIEGGYFRETYRSEEMIPGEYLPQRLEGERHIATSIYFLIYDNVFSAFHKLKGDELWHHVDGEPVHLYFLMPNGELKIKKLGKEPEKGYYPQLFVERNIWFAGRVRDSNGFSLVTCTTSPGFDYRDFALGKREELAKEFPMHEKIIDELTLA
ncbi:MAG: hypothetical protein BRD49_03875 [Bacteroidetes bacterium SW_10_40_5]|nr:MAG: hypothetical protein BRD49_03875 [Bacteroidetes bacterium SW_10_40_5]